MTRDLNVCLIRFRLQRGGLICLTALSGLLFAIGPLAAQPGSPGRFSERVGNVIDNTARAYFSLFPGMADFSGATVRLDVPSIIVARSGLPDTTMTISPDAARELGILIDKFESVYRGERVINWALLRGLAAPAQPFDEGKEVTVATRNGPEYTGTLLYVADSLLLLWPVDSLYDWRAADRLLLAIHVDDIATIRTPDAYAEAFGIGILLGSIGSYVIDGQPRSTETFLLAPVPLMLLPYLGGVISRNYFGVHQTINGQIGPYHQVRNEIAGRAFFQRLPPELTHRHSTFLSVKGSELLVVKPEVQEQPETPTRLHLLAMLGTKKSPVGSFELNTIGRLTTHEVESGSRIYFFNALYSIIPILSLGVNYLFNNRMSNDTTNREYMNLTAYGVTADIAVSPIDLPVIGMLSIGMGAGVGTARMQGAGRVTCPFEDCTTFVDYSFNETAPAIFLNVGVNINIMRNVSLHARTQQFITGSITVPETIVNGNLDPVRRLHKHSLNPSFSTVMFGAQIHL